MREVGTDAHHIVAKWHWRHREARRILKKHGIGVNQEINGVFLPRTSKVSKAPGALHAEKGSALTNRVHMDAVTERISQADARGGKEAVLRELATIRKKLLDADFPGVKANPSVP